MLQMKNNREIGSPLTLEQIRERSRHPNIIGYAGVIQDFDRHMLYCGLCDYLDDELICTWNGMADDNYLQKDYGTQWVLWDHIPNKEEMAAAKEKRYVG